MLQQQLGDQPGRQSLLEMMQPGGAMSTVAGAQAVGQAFQQNPYALTQMALGQPSNTFGRNFSMLYASMDVSSRTGAQTGMPWGTSGLGRGVIPAPMMAQRIWGQAGSTQLVGATATQPIVGGTPYWQTSQVGTAMTTGYESPFGEQLYGEQSYQQQQSDLSYGYQMQQYGFQQQQYNLQSQYIPQFRQLQTQQVQAGYRQAQVSFGLSMAGVGVQIAQIQLGHQQFGEQMALQQEQFNLQGTQFTQQQALQATQFAAGQSLQTSQFFQNIGMQQRQTGMQRTWTQQDWGYQAQQREQAWGWRQEDFAESSRFMTGRERKLAERQMGRESTVYGQESDQIEKQKARQKEIWKLEDERFALSKKQFQEQLDLQKTQFNESRELQRRFFDEGRELQQKNMDMQKRHEAERYRLSLAAAGVQAAQIAAAKAAFEENFALSEQQRKLQYEYEDEQRRIQKEQLDATIAYAIQQKKNSDDYMQYLRTHDTIIGQQQLALGNLNQFVGNLNTAIGNIQTKVSNFQTALNNFSFAGFFSNMWNNILNLFGAGGGGKQTGAMFTVPPGYPNDSYVVRASTGESVMIAPTDKGIRPSSNWNNIVGNMITYPNSPSGNGGGGVPIVLIVNVGNERLGRFVIDAVSKSLEVR
jgi:hypothetical protein